MTEVTYREAITRALAEELDADPDVILLGEDIGAAGGVFKATQGLFERFGAMRVRDTPISEQAIVGAAIGASLRGLRPVAEIMFGDFAATCFDGIVNELAKYRYMTGGQVVLPVTIRMTVGAGGGFGAQHSQTVENWFLNVPGLKLVVPGTPADAHSLLRAAIRDPDPVLFFEHKALYALSGALNDAPRPLALGVGDVVRPGEHVTVVATQLMRHRAVEAADLVSREGISVEVIDPRTLVPFDLSLARDSVAKTNRLVVVQECSLGGSWGATLVAALLQDDLEAFDAPPRIVGGDETPVPVADALEAAWIPSPERIAEAIRVAVAY